MNSKLYRWLAFVFGMDGWATRLVKELLSIPYLKISSWKPKNDLPFGFPKVGYDFVILTRAALLPGTANDILIFHSGFTIGMPLNSLVLTLFTLQIRDVRLVCSDLRLRCVSGLCTLSVELIIA